MAKRSAQNLPLKGKNFESIASSPQSISHSTNTIGKEQLTLGLEQQGLFEHLDNAFREAMTATSKTMPLAAANKVLGDLTNPLKLIDSVSDKYSSSPGKKCENYLNLAMKAVKEIDKSLQRNESFFKLTKLAKQGKMNLKLAGDLIAKIALENPLLAAKYYLKLKAIGKKLQLKMRKIKAKHDKYMEQGLLEEKSKKKKQALKEKAYQEGVSLFTVDPTFSSNPVLKPEMG